jgi:16S rRNA (adenine1518-N6/adenine1519-N6)-dimethyltransferase
MSGFASIPPLDAARLLQRYGLKPDRSLGQNFLQDPEALEAIASAADLDREDTALEIGPGLGSLTRYLAAAAGRVVAVELDERLLPALRATLAACGNVEIIQGDILKLEPARLVGQDGYVVAANIPYYITSAVTRHLLDRAAGDDKGVHPRRMVLTVQKEVAARICADPGDLSLLALSVQVYGKPRITGTVPASAFYPVPNVDSACLRVDMYGEPLVPPELLGWFFRAAKAGFSQKRKTLRNSLSGGLQLSTTETESLLEKAGISPQRRAETVSIEEWGRLAADLRALNS